MQVKELDYNDIYSTSLHVCVLVNAQYVCVGSTSLDSQESSSIGSLWPHTAQRANCYLKDLWTSETH